MSTPKPRSFQNILGSMIDTFRARTGIGSLRVGDPILTFLEAAAQADTRAAQDIFTALNSTDLERATGVALEALGAEEGLKIRGATAATGYVTFTDTSFAKVSSTIYAGTPAPVAGTRAIHIVDGAAFPPTGQVYLGRGTASVEGPLPYTAIENHGSHWTITLTTPTTLFHNVGESVVLAQGGDRSIPEGTVVRTTGSPATAIPFETTEDATIEDGEVSVTGVHVVCQTPGTVGNVAKDSIVSMPSPPFSGASVTNPLPFVSGAEVESEESFRQRIRDARKDRPGVTARSIRNRVIGTYSPVESKRVMSASTVAQEGRPTTLYIDDGSGYEELALGQPFETIVDSAFGGEYLFQLSRRPVVKPFVESSTDGPWTIRSGTLEVKVGATIATHTFSPEDFRDIRSATVHEVVASINSNTALPFSARSSSGGRRVALFAKGPSNEDISVLPTSSANEVFGFPEKSNTLRLYRNGRLLYREGSKATLTSVPSAEWAFSTPILRINVDGTGWKDYLFEEHHFDGYLPLPSTPAAAWAEAINRVVPGVVATATGATVSVSSARGANNTASLAIDETGIGSIFSERTAFGRTSDYSLNAATGELALAEPLEEGDTLTAGSTVQSAYLKSEGQFPVTFDREAAFFFVLDSPATVTDLPLAPHASVTVSMNHAGLVVIQMPFLVEDFIRVGDWVVVWDGAFETPFAGKVPLLGGDLIYLYPSEFDPSNVGTKTLTQRGISIVSTEGKVTTSTVPSGTYSLSSLAEALNVPGGNVSVGEAQTLLVSSATVGEEGLVTLVGANTDARKVGFPDGSAGTIDGSSTAWVSSRAEMGTPILSQATASSSSIATLPLTAEEMRAAHITGGTFISVISGPSAGASLLLEDEALQTLRAERIIGGIVAGDRMHGASAFAIGPEDTLQLSVDGDTLAQPLYRAIRRRSSFYAKSFQVEELDGRSLSETFPEFSFNDFAVYAQPKAITHRDTSRAILWRYNRFGPDGNGLTVEYGLPSAPSSPLSVDVDGSRLIVRLPSTEAKSLPVSRAKFSVSITSQSTNVYRLAVENLSLDISSVSRDSTGKTTIVRAGSVDVRDLIRQGQTVWVSPVHPALPSGPKVVTEVSSDRFSYMEIGPELPSTADSGTVQFSETLPNFSIVEEGDIVSLSLAGLKIVGRAPSDGLLNSVEIVVPWSAVAAVPHSLTNVSLPDLTVYSIDSSQSTVGEIARSVDEGLLTATVLGDEAAVISQSSFDDWVEGSFDWTTPFVDGVNWVSSLDLDTDTLTLKADVHPSLAGTLEEEELRLAPITAAGAAAFLSAPATGGLSVRGKVSSTAEGKVQIASTTSGRSGEVKVLGGSGNFASATVQAPAQLHWSEDNSTYVLSVPVSPDEAQGFIGGSWVDIVSASPPPEPIGSLTDLDIVSGKESVVYPNPPFAARETTGQVTITKFGEFAFVQTTIPAHVSAGEYVTISGAEPPNNGTYWVVGRESNPGWFWIRNPLAVSEQSSSITVQHFSGAPFPGDRLVIQDPSWGAGNLGEWTVKKVLSSGAVVVDGTMEEISKVDLPAGGAFIRRLTPEVLTKRIKAIVPSDGQVLFLFDDLHGNNLISPAYGSTVIARDKLGFDTATHKGLDGYHYHSGLIGEVSRVLYGDERDTHTYPGILPVGTSVDISGPLVRRVSVSLQVRLLPGATATDVNQRIRSAVAMNINSRAVGESIPLSDIVAAARVSGVRTVAILSPEYSSASDIITIYPHEKPLVIVPEEDISIRVVGED